MGCQTGGLVPVFPDCGDGSGGGAGAWTIVDLDDGSWSIADPAGLVADVIVEGNGVHQFIEATVAAGATLVYSTPTYSAWRAYKPLTDADGNAITCGAGTSSIDINVRYLDPEDIVANAIVAMGIAVAPSSEVYADIKASAIGFHQSAVPVVNGHFHDPAGGSFLVGANQVGAFGTILCGAGTQVCTVAMSYDASEVRVSNGSRNFIASPGIGAATPLFLWIEYCKRTNSDAGVEDADLRCQLAYRVNPAVALL